MIERGRRIDDHAPAADLHELRKAVKAVRYVVECFDDLSDERSRRRYAKRLRRLQAVLGAHQDADVHIVMVERIAVELHTDGTSATTLLALGRMTERLTQLRAEARARFVDEWAVFDTPATAVRLDALLGAFAELR